MCKSPIFESKAFGIGLGVCMLGLLVLSPQFSLAAARIQTVPHLGSSLTSGKQSPRLVQPDPRLLQFNSKLVAYKQTLAELRADVMRLQSEDRQLSAIIRKMQDVNAQQEMAMIKLQDVISQRTRVIQFASNVFHKLSEGNKEIIKHIK